MGHFTYAFKPRLVLLGAHQFYVHNILSIHPNKDKRTTLPPLISFKDVAR